MQCLSICQFVGRSVNPYFFCTRPVLLGGGKECHILLIWRTWTWLLEHSIIQYNIWLWFYTQKVWNTAYMSSWQPPDKRHKCRSGTKMVNGWKHVRDKTVNRIHIHITYSYYVDIACICIYWYDISSVNVEQSLVVDISSLNH
jgi:hypothetical protein